MSVTINDATWTPIGPAPLQTAGGLGAISGRVEAAAPHPTDPTVLYIGANGGGVWKNINPPGWLPLTDQQPSLSFGGYRTLVVHPKNPDLVLGAVSGQGAGILQSPDSGATWRLLANGQFNGASISALVVLPTDTLTMYLAAGGQGAWKSTDGGNTWQQLSNLPGGSVSDVILTRWSSNVLFAGVVGNTGGATANNGVYKSTDGGNTWKITSLPSGAALGLPNASGAVRLESGTASGVVYASILTVSTLPGPPPTNAVTAVARYKTTDGGTTWTPLTATGTLENRSWHLVLGVDPKDDTHIFANGAYSLWESTDSGSSWTHADTGIGWLSFANPFDWVNLAFDANDDVVATADQGAFRYRPSTKAWTSLIADLEVSEFYTITPDPKSQDVVYAVGQDINSEKFAGVLKWNVMENGVGEIGRFQIDPGSTNRIAGFNPRDSSNFVMISTDAGSTWNNKFPGALLSSNFLAVYNLSLGYNFAYAAQKAFVMDATNSNRVLVCSDQVFETTNAFAASPTWTPISNALSTDPTNPFVIALAIAPSDPNTVYAATQDGHLWVTHDDGAQWVEQDSGLSGNVGNLCIDPQNRDHVFTIAGGNVWELSPATAQWSSRTGNLPTQFGLNTLFVDWRSTIPALMVGTNRGIYLSLNLGQTWGKFSPGLPNVQVNDLQGVLLPAPTGGQQLVIAAATYGRGAWEIVFKLWGAAALLIADTGVFHGVCLGSFADEVLTIDNTGSGPLQITSITSSGSDFLVPEVLFYPLVIAPGGALEVPIRFQPGTPAGGKSATITVLSDDPTGPHTIVVRGEAKAPRLSLVIADAGDFGPVCANSFVDEPLLLNNSSSCPLIVTGIASSSGDFLVPTVLSGPLIIGAGGSLAAPIRFAPTTLGHKTAIITVTSNDPAGPQSITVSGDTPSGKLVVTGSTFFGGVRAHRRAERTIYICNMGECSLHVASVAFKRKSRHWRLINNPFPTTLPPGACLPLVLRYKATQKFPHLCELVIHSDDPSHPVKTVEVLARTIWPDRDRDEDEDEDERHPDSERPKDKHR